MLALFLLSGCLIDTDRYERRRAEILAQADEDDSGSDCVRVRVWVDADGDGFGNADYPDERCAPFDGWVEDATDCDDGDAAVNPDAAEVCATPADDDCDGTANEDGPDGVAVYADTDGDGFGDPAVSATACAVGEGWTEDATDCADGDAGVHPGAEEVCGTGVDEDCDAGTSCRLEGEVSVGEADVTWVGTGASIGFPAPLGDFSADGGDEVALVTAGAVYLVGDPGDGEHALVDTALGITNAADSELRLARAIATDLDGDGAPELVVTAQSEDVIGPTAIYWLPASGVTSVSAATAAILSDSTNSAYGFSAAASTDLSGDGVPELVVSELAIEDTSYVHLLQASGTELSRDEVALIAGEPGDALGYAIATGDANDDGVEDLLLTAPMAEGGRGGAYVFHGPVSGFLALDAADSRIFGGVVDDNLGVSVVFEPFLDADGDGDMDILLSAWGASTRASEGGAAYLFSGPLGSRLEVSDAAGTYLGGHAEAGMGWAVGSAGDVDGDGLEDLLLGANPPGSTDTTGRSYLIYGPGFGTHLETELPVTFRPGTGESRLGSGPIGAGDLDGDGLDDVLLVDPGAAEGLSAAYLFRGAGR